MQLFPPSGPLEVLVKDILGVLTRTRQRNRFVVVMIGRYSKLTSAISTAIVTAPLIVTTFLENLIVPYRVPNTVWCYNGPQFVPKFFAVMCTSLGTRLVATTECHPQFSGQVERYNKTLLARLHRYVDEHQTKWDLFGQLTTYRYNTQANRTTRTSPCSPILS